MSKYKIWDKQSDIYTLGTDEKGRNHFTAQQYIEEFAPWAAIPGSKVIVGGGLINGTVFMEFDACVEHYKGQGAAIEDGMSDEEVLAAIEEFEANPPNAGEPTSEERIASALEFQNIMAMLMNIEEV